MNQIINDRIRELQYDPIQVLAFKGDQISNFVPNEAQLENGKYIIVQREKMKVENADFDIVVVNSMHDRTYPGALLLANEKLVNNMPTSLQCKRAPITLRANFTGVGADGTVTVNNPSNSSVSEAINGMLNSWYEKYADTNSLPAYCSYSEARVYSEKQISVALGCNFNLFGADLNIDFKSISNHKKSTYVLAFKQIFYTVSMNAAECPAAVFDDSVTWDMLVGAGVDEKNPPVYVGNVAYGRIIYVAIETDYMNDDIEAHLKLAIKDNKLDSDVMHKSIFDNCKYTAIAIGGSADANTKVVTKDFAEIEKIIANGAVLSKSNPAAPIAYTTVFLKNNEVGVVNGSTEYISTTATEYTSGAVNLKHTGGYIAKFDVNWKERSFNDDGAEILTQRGWERNGQSLTAPFTTVIPIPANAIDIHVRATNKTGLVWEPWRTIINQNIPLAPNVQVSVWGTTLNSKGSVEVR